MATLDQALWARHHRDLRPFVRYQWPDIEPGELEQIGADWERLADRVQRAGGIARAEARAQLEAIEIPDDELAALDAGPVAGEPTDAGTAAGAPAAAAEPENPIDVLRLDGGIAAEEREWVLDHFRDLGRRLEPFDPHTVDFAVRVSDRDATTQKVTAELRLPSLPTIVATSDQQELAPALSEVSSDLRRQVTGAIDRRREH